MKRSITMRLVLMFAAATLITFSLIGTALYGVLQRELLRHQQDELHTAYQDMEYMIKRAGDPVGWSRVKTKMDTLMLANAATRFWAISDHPEYQYGTDLARIKAVKRASTTPSGDGLNTLTLPQRVGQGVGPIAESEPVAADMKGEVESQREGDGVSSAESTRPIAGELTTSASSPSLLPSLSKLSSDGRGILTLPERTYPLYTFTKTISAYKDRPPIQFTVGIDSTPYVHTLHTFLIALVTLSLTAVLLVMLFGYWITRVGLRPLKQLSSEAQTLSPKTLSQRLHISPLPDELSDLTTAFNGALGRLESAYNQLEAFNADVAHELRTPLTNLIGETQVALSRQRTAPEFQEVLQSNLEELERLRSIVNDMLFLARADQGEAATGLVRTPIAQEVSKTIEFLEFILDESHVTIGIDGDIAAEALIETALFRRAMANLLQNAIQHSRSGAKILVNIIQQPSLIQIAVSNPGEPIAQAHLPLLFDRFYRVDAARHDNGESHGHGLGLAIVKAVATMHGGDVFANSEQGITTIGFSVRLAT